MPQSFASLHCHIIFSTKGRAPMIKPDVELRLIEYIGGILHKRGCQLVKGGGERDHLHLLVSFSREISVAEAMRLVKANSSKWIHETFPDQARFAWQAGYGAFAVSYSNLEAVKKYIANQKEHHKKMTFQEEFMEFLKRHKIEFEERYVWD